MPTDEAFNKQDDSEDKDKETMQGDLLDQLLEEMIDDLPENHNNMQGEIPRHFSSKQTHQKGSHLCGY